MNASEQIDDLIAGVADWRGTTLANFRRVFREADPELVEDVKWRSPKTLIIAAVEYNQSKVRAAAKPRAAQLDAKKKSVK